jgi:uncharacterized membrane protein (DUF4010 family)
VKYFGASRGVLIAAAAGGLVSSTAVTLANARRAAANEGSPRLLAGGVAVASAVSFVRVLTIAAVLQPRLLILIGPALLAATLAAVGFALVSTFWRTSGMDARHEVKFRNPFGFWAVIGFAIFLAAVIVLGRAVGEGFGTTGAVAGAVAVGFVDVDSVTVSLAHLTPNPLGLEQAAYAVLAAVSSNLVSKMAIGAAIGRGWFAAEISIMTVLCLVAAGFALATTHVLSPL